MIVLSPEPWYESYNEEFPIKVWEQPIRECGFEIYKVTNDDIKDFIQLNPKLSVLGGGLDDWFNQDNIGTSKFFELLRSKQIYHRRVVEFNDSQKEWLRNKFEGKVCIFDELHPIDEETLNELGISYISFFLSPIRFVRGPSRPIAIYSNNDVIMDKLNKFRYPSWLYYFFSLFMRFEKRKGISKVNNNNFIEDNSCLIIGQCRFDYSKYDYKNKRFVQLSDYESEFIELKKKYKKLYYTKHPHELYIYEKDFLDRLGIEVLDNIDSYTLMLSKKIRGVCALSSSMLTESRIFGKNEHRLFTNFVDIEKCLIISTRNVRDKKFWERILK